MDFSQLFSGAEEWQGPAFDLFGPAHLVGILIFLILVTLMVIFRKKITPTWDKWIRIGLVVVLLSNEFMWHLWNYVCGTWTLQEMLPLHVCSVFVWLGSYMLITKNYTIFEFMYLIGIIAALQAFLTPDAGMFGFPHFRFFQVLISHGFLMLGALYMALVTGFRPTWASVRKVIIIGNLYGVLVFCVNSLIGSNYMFINHKPVTASVLDVLPPWPYYLIIIELMGVTAILLFYLPYAIADWNKNRKSIKEMQPV